MSSAIAIFQCIRTMYLHITFCIFQYITISVLQLQLFDTYEQFFLSMEKQLQKGDFPLILFKNLTKKVNTTETIFRASKSTFMTELNTDALNNLTKLTTSTYAVSIAIIMFLLHLHLACNNVN